MKGAGALAASLLFVLPVEPAARAEPAHVLRMAAVAPEGTAWARELKAFARDVESRTKGGVRIKWYLGGIAGDDVQVSDRVRRDQLDGVASGGMLCERIAPTMRALSVLGLFQTRQESAYVMTRMKPELDHEFAQAGFVNLAEAGLGAQVILSRAPVKSLADLRQGKFWIWDLDDVLRGQVTELGIGTVPAGLDAAARAYDEGRTDGFIAIPSAALAFQWSTQAQYISDLRIAFLSGCLLVVNRAWDQMPLEDQQVVRASAAKLQVRMEELGRGQDEALLGGLFTKQGLRSVPVSDAFRSEFFEAARAAREHLSDKTVPHALIGRISEMLIDFRAEHSAR
jgi:TRAP-type C4-dicarboxylate transport system substrate-binding protein